MKRRDLLDGFRGSGAPSGSRFLLGCGGSVKILRRPSAGGARMWPAGQVCFLCAVRRKTDERVFVTLRGSPARARQLRGGFVEPGGCGTAREIRQEQAERGQEDAALEALPRRAGRPDDYNPHRRGGYFRHHGFLRGRVVRRRDNHHVRRNHQRGARRRAGEQGRGRHRGASGDSGGDEQGAARREDSDAQERGARPGRRRRARSGRLRPRRRTHHRMREHEDRGGGADGRIRPRQ